MKRADRYIAWNVLTSMALTLAIFVALDLFFSLISELGDVGKGDYSAQHALWYVLLTLPRRIHTLFPVAAVVGALVGVGGLAATSELVALRAAGMSRLRIALSCLFATLLGLVPVLIAGEVLSPTGEYAAQNMRAQTQSAGVAVSSGSDLWVRDGDTIIHARRPVIEGRGDAFTVRLANVDIFSFKDGQLESASVADEGLHDGVNWTLSNVNRSHFVNNRVETSQRDEVVWDSLLDPSVLQTAITRPRQLALSELIPYVAYLRKNELDATAYNAAIWWRIAYPFGVLAVVLAGMPFVFGHWRSGGLGQRLLIGMVIGVGFYIVNRTVATMGEVYGFNPVLSSFVPSLVLAFLALTLLRKSR